MTIETKRGPGRPRIHEREPGRIEVRLDPEVRRRIRIAAAEDDMALSEWMVRAAERDLARRESLPTRSEGE